MKKIKRPSGAFPSLPSGMDKVLKEHFDRFMALGKLPPELSALPEMKGYSLFSDAEKLKEWRSNFKGISYTDVSSGVILHGAVDNILVKGDKLTVLDYKTRGFPLKEDSGDHYELQMDIYNFLLRENGYKTEDFTYLLFYYPEKVLESGEVLFNTSLMKIKTDPERGEKIFQKAIKVINGEMPDSGEDCEFCKFKSGS